MNGRKDRNVASRYSALQQIYRENYLEDVSNRLSREAVRERKHCS